DAVAGDLVFIIVACCRSFGSCWLGVRYKIKATTHEHPQDVLFVEVQPADGEREP
ncbi:hypothetical protein GS532_12480, partial [Rhodococcus hoagii]|nr:hypothetical protein [Prescottella equi]